MPSWSCATEAVYIMADMREEKTVREQYSTADNLNVRLRFQGKHSTNKYGFNRWIFDQYEFRENSVILELGCGQGTLWREYYGKLPTGCRLTLSDFSEGMLNAARENLKGLEGVDFKQIDIQAIPFPDESADAVIANMMLYHVPDIFKALGEVRRVLKKGSSFYSATYGENGILKYIGEAFAPYGGQTSFNDCFTLQNGEAQLKKYFGSVERREYPDSFEVTDVDDMLDYMASLSEIIDMGTLTREEAKSVLEGRKKNGSIHIPKEYGLFISRK